MGADGGVAWVTLRAGESPAALRRLLAPWWYWLTHLGSRAYKDSRTHWIRAHEADHPRAVFGGYGTDLDACDDPSWLDLAAWAEHLDDALTDPARGLPDAATFADYLEERDTRPDGWWSSGCDSPSLDAWERELREVGADLHSVAIRGWLDALTATIEGLDAHCVETWT